MGYIENLQAQAAQAAKAKAYDDMQSRMQMDGLASEAYARGKFDRDAEMRFQAEEDAKIARMNEIARYQAQQGTPEMELRQRETGMINAREELPMGLDPRSITPEQAVQMGLAQASIQ